MSNCRKAPANSSGTKKVLTRKTVRALGQRTSPSSPRYWQTWKTSRRTKLAGAVTPLGETLCYIRKTMLWHNTWTHCTSGQSSGIQEPKFCRISSLCKRALPYQGLAKYEAAMKAGWLEPVGFEGNERRQAVYSLLVNPLDNNPNKKNKDYKHLKSHHDAIYVVDMERERNGRTSSSTKSSTAAWTASTRFPRSTSQKVIHVRDKAETDASIRGAVANIPSKRTFVTAPWKMTRCTSIALVIDKDTLLERALFVTEVPRTSGRIEWWSRRTTWKTAVDTVFTEQGASALQVAVARFLYQNFLTPWHGGWSQRRGISLRYTCERHPDYCDCQIKSAHKWITRPPSRRPKQRDAIEEPVVPFERKLVGHPVSGLLWDGKLEEVQVHQKSQLLLSICVDDIKMVGKRNMWDLCGKMQRKEFDLEDSTRFCWIKVHFGLHPGREQKLSTMLYKQKHTCSDAAPPHKVTNEKHNYKFVWTDHCVELRFGSTSRNMSRMVLRACRETRIGSKADGHAVHGSSSIYTWRMYKMGP